MVAADPSLMYDLETWAERHIRRGWTATLQEGPLRYLSCVLLKDLDKTGDRAQLAGGVNSAPYQLPPVRTGSSFAISILLLLKHRRPAFGYLVLSYNSYRVNSNENVTERAVERTVHSNENVTEGDLPPFSGLSCYCFCCNF